MRHQNPASLVGIVCLAVALCWPSNTYAGENLDSSTVVSTIAFGSCANQNKPCPIWESIGDYSPELLLLLGDNIYADLVDGRLKPSTPNRIAEAYQQLADLPAFDSLRKSVPILATWDDHDYGNNDAGREWEHKHAAAKLFHDFFGTPADSPLRDQEGVYQAHIFGTPGKRIQVILLDTRYFRSELAKAAEPMPGFRARPYIPATQGESDMLGEKQWKWLRQELLKPAELRVLCSSIQVLSNDHPFEKWGNFPAEQARLFELIRECEASGVVIVSGDRHLGEISLDPTSVGYPLYDVTASGLNQANQGWRATEPNRLRLAALQYGNHFGSIEVDWDASDPQVRLQLRSEDGTVAVQTIVGLSRLKVQRKPLPLAQGAIGPAAALRRNEGEQVVVQFRVQGGRVIGNPDRILLNSEQNFRAPGNFTVVVQRSALSGELASAGINAFLDQTVRITGKISLYRGAKQINVESSEQLELVE
ncbi:MAG: alkaline phosphatase D family protein [Planctomycetota bacterium]